MSSTTVSYEHFVPLGETINVKDLRYPKDEFAIAIDLYGAVPLGIDDYSVTVDGKTFCSLGKAYTYAVLEWKDVYARLQVNTRKSDYQFLLKNPTSAPIPGWDRHGNLVGVPTNVFLDPRPYASYQAWDDAQYAKWVTILTVLGLAKPEIPYNVYSRFIQPPTDQFVLYFTPPEKGIIFTKEILSSVFKNAFSDKDLDLPQYTYKIINYKDAKDQGLVLVGSNYFNWYHTWMVPKDFQNIWKQMKTPVLPRPWIPQDSANKVDLALHGGDKGERGSQVTNAQMSAYKVASALGQRGNYQGQKAVMGGSATMIAEAVWDKNTLTGGRPADAEWLHRNAFHFGGLEDTVDLASSQTRRNLVFGTGECNTHMIRAENAITSLLAADSKISGDSKRSGLLRTTNNFSGSVARMNADGSRGNHVIPTYVNQEKFMWMSFKLTYQWKMKTALFGGQAVNASWDFDPFSRYIPLRVEARLDDALMEFALNQAIDAAAAASSSSSSSSSSSGKGSKDDMAVVDSVNLNAVPNANSAQHLMLTAVPTLPVTPNPPINQEPMLAWHAARSKLPHITIAGVQVTEPVALFEEEAPATATPSSGPGDTAKPAALVSQEQPTTGSVLKSVNDQDITARIQALKKASVAAAVPKAPPLPVTPAPGSLPPQTGFVLSGKVALFGIKTLQAKFEVWEGPAPAGIKLRPNEPASVQRASLTGDFHLSSILPEAKGTAFDRIIFRNVSVLHQNYQFDTTKSILSTVLGVKDPTLNIQMALGTKGDWNKGLDLNSFTLEGTFAGIAIKPVNGLALTSIGVRLFGIRSLRFTPEPQTAISYGFAVFGTMNIDVPNSALPLSLSYAIEESSGTVYIAADIDQWRDPLGAKGLLLQSASFTTSFALTKPLDSLTFDVSAYFAYRDTSAAFTGCYAPGGGFTLSASIGNFSMDNISDLFDWISGGELSIPDLDVKIGNATIVVGSQAGLSITLDNIAIGDYTSVDASLQITSHGVLIRGDLTSSVIEFGDVEVKKAFLQLAIEKDDSGSQTDVIVGGEVAFSSLTFDAAVHLYELKVGQDTSLQWTVLASLTSGDESMALSKVVPEIGGTFLDLALKQVVFVAASRDDPSLGNMIVSGYAFHQGVQICATLDELGPLNSLMRGPVPGLVLSAGWSKVKGFELDILLPNPINLNLGDGITTTPIKLAIQTQPVELILSAGISVPVANSPAPLVFTLSLGADLLGASATGEMAGWWVNPMGLSPAIKIGPNLALSIDIIFAQFVTTGTPSGFGLRGGLMIGKTQAQVALSINEDPMKELLYAEVQSLNISDVVSFASDITGLSIPQPPSDFLDFEEVKLYICPAGVTLGTITYPQGFSFAATMVLFGKKADIACLVDNSEVSLKGGVDNFSLGPLSIHGTTGPRATIDCEIGASTQHILIDGVITWFAEECAIHIEVAVLPSPKFAWSTIMKFTELLTFQLNAELVGALTFEDLGNADFVFDALLEQHILQYIHDQVVAQLDQATQAAEAGLESAKDKVSQAQKVLDDNISAAQAELDQAAAEWNAKNKSIHDASDPIIAAYNAEITRLQNAIIDARAAFNSAMNNAQQALNNANTDRGQKLADAQHSVDDASRDMTSKIGAAQSQLDQANADMNRDFGSAERDIESARSNVQSLQNQIDDLNGTIHDYEDASWLEFWKKAALGGLYTALGALEASKASADGVLQGAEAVLSSANYLAEQAAINTAQQALSAAQTAGQAALDAANQTLHAVDVATQAVVDAANQVVTATAQGTEWLAFQGAVQALSAYKDANDAVFQAAQDAITGLMQTAEYLAYQAATTALTIARSATTDLYVAKQALSVVEDATKDALAVGKWLADHVSDLGLIDIRLVRLSGSLRGIIGEGGSDSKPLTAHVEGMVMEKPFTLDGEFDPRHTAEFITSIFKKVWDDISSLI